MPLHCYAAEEALVDIQLGQYIYLSATCLPTNAAFFTIGRRGRACFKRLNLRPLMIYPKLLYWRDALGGILILQPKTGLREQSLAVHEVLRQS